MLFSNFFMKVGISLPEIKELSMDWLTDALDTVVSIAELYVRLNATLVTVRWNGYFATVRGSNNITFISPPCFTIKLDAFTDYMLAHGYRVDYPNGLDIWNGERNFILCPSE
jgi:hypothetical protein